MRPFGFWPVWALTVILATGPTALALVVVNEDFEDDTPSSYDPANSVEPGLEGLPVNNGRPGRWLPNQYDQLTWFNNPWHDDLDTNPDTNWQLQVMQDIGPPRPGNEAFYQNQHTNCELYLHCQFIEDDCSALGLSSPGPCDNDRFSRDGFIQFATWDPNANGGNGAHVPRPAVTGEKVSGRFDWVIFDGVPLFGLVDDIQAMADSTSDEDLHPALTKWNVGFGQPFNPMDEGLEAWFSGNPQHPNVVSIIAGTQGFNQRATDTWIPYDTSDLSQNSFVIALDPDFPWAFETSNPGSDIPYQTFLFEYTVGNSVYDYVAIDFNDGNGPQEVRQAMKDDGSVDCGAPADHPACDIQPRVEAGGKVPISQPGPRVDGLVFTDTGWKMATYVFDDICIVIDGTLDECDGAPAPLLGDANNDNQVTGADLISVQQNFGKDYTNGSCDGLGLGDANDDCLVTGADLIAVQQNFGKTAAAVVPEPMVTALIGFGVLAMLGRRRT